MALCSEESRCRWRLVREESGTRGSGLHRTENGRVLRRRTRAEEAVWGPPSTPSREGGVTDAQVSGAGSCEGV